MGKGSLDSVLGTKLLDTGCVVEERTILLSSQAWVAGDQRNVDVYCSEKGFTLKTENGKEYFIASDGETIGKLNSSAELDQLDREVLLGPALVFALALRHIWSVHSSAVLRNGKLAVFLAESGTGKSTLAKYLSGQMNWSLVADDILPVTCNENGLTAWPHFPQLKLPADAQPGLNLPEQLPLNMMCELVPVDVDVAPEIRRLSPEQAVMVLLGHTAGSRLFDAKMLEDHLAFCAQAAERVPVYQLSYPHSVDALPRIKGLLESIC